MGSNQSATTSPIPVFQADYQGYQGQPMGGYPAGAYPAGDYPAPPVARYKSAPPVVAAQFGPDPSGQYPPGPSGQFGPRAGPRRGPPPGMGYPQGGNPPFDPTQMPIPPGSRGPNIFGRDRRPTVQDVMDYADGEWAYEDEADMFRSPPPRNNPPFQDPGFDPFARYKARNGGVGPVFPGGEGQIVPQQEPTYRCPPKPKQPPPQAKTFHLQGPPTGPLHFDSSSGDLFHGGQLLPQAPAGYMPPAGFGAGPAGNPNIGIVFPNSGGYGY